MKSLQKASSQPKRANSVPPAPSLELQSALYLMILECTGYAQKGIIFVHLLEKKREDFFLEGLVFLDSHWTVPGQVWLVPNADYLSNFACFGSQALHVVAQRPNSKSCCMDEKIPV